MGQALYRKYRSKSLSEIVGQDHIVTTLRNAIKNGAISHAYLFTGPRGVGKTSIARILAREVNGLKYDETTAHMDIIEIDAASNRRIDEIRDLRDKVHIMPTSAKYKVYIIDEVHMLTKEAFNALLKTLEEPPAHVIFILATTEVHKLPETIISRTQRFTFKPITVPKAIEHMREIAEAEGTKISDEALAVIAEHGDGSFRDSISLLDQVSNHGNKIEVEDIRLMLGIAPEQTIHNLYDLTLNGSPKTLVEALQATEDQGYEASHIAKQLGSYMRTRIIDGTLSNPVVANNLLRQLIEVPSSSNPALYLEVTLLDINIASSTNTTQTATSQISTVPADPATHKPLQSVDKPPKSKATSKSTAAKTVEEVSAVPAPTVASDTAASVVTMDFDEAWPEVLNTVKQKYNTLYGLLRMSKPTFVDNKLSLGFSFAFHQKRINDPKNKKIIMALLEKHMGYPVSITCTLENSANNSEASLIVAAAEDKLLKPETLPPVLDTITNIFGGAEVLES